MRRILASLLAALALTLCLVSFGSVAVPTARAMVGKDLAMATELEGLFVVPDKLIRRPIC